MKIVNDDGSPITRAGLFGGAWSALLAVAGKAASVAAAVLAVAGPLASIAVLCLMLGAHPGCTPLPPWPAPPAPAPVPAPVDPLTATFQAAYDADPDPAKAAHVKELASLWASAASQVKGPAVTTASQMLAAAHAAANGLVGADGLPKVRRAVGDYLNGSLGTKDATLDDAARARLSGEFTKVATALEGIK